MKLKRLFYLLCKQEEILKLDKGTLVTMRIGMILCKPYPPDIRVEKEARTLIEAGHDLFVLAERKDGELKNETVLGTTVNRYYPPRPFRRRLDWIRFNTSFKSAFWESRIRRFVKRNDIDIIHTHDLPLVGTAVKVAIDFDLPIIADLHENYPEAQQLWSEKSRNPLVWFTNNRKRWENYERNILPHTNEVISVVKEGAERLQNSGVVSIEKMTIIMNVEDKSWFDKLATSKRINDDVIRVVYVGGVRPHRGLDIVIKALVELPSKHKVSLRVVGAKGNYALELMQLAKQIGIEDRIELIEWIPLEEIPNAILECDIGIVPHKKHPQQDASLPHKLFQYMLAKKPVIVSNCKSLERIVKETESGLVFDSGNSSNLAEKILKLVENPELCRELGLNGRRAAIERYSWELEGQKLANLYKKYI